MKALDDALEYYARLERGGASPVTPNSERHQRTATAPSSSTNAHLFASQRVQQLPASQQQPANQQLHVATELRGQVSIQGFNRGPASFDGHDRRQFQRTPSPSGYQPPSPTAASYHGHTSATSARDGPASVDGHGYRDYGQQPTTQAPSGSGRPQPATWSRAYGRR
ncbi:hypothetical protein FRC01_007846 [Tulasnella sp. 417]|nr:hypothetical protein FRC01_007846 [Tulasnella sp. 417]